MHIPYTYLLIWTTTNMKYYGVRYARGCNPSDLFKTYYTSSNYVKQYIKIHGLPDIVQIRRIFSDATHAQLWEQKVLTRIQAASRTDYLNKHNGGKGFHNTDYEVRLKMSQNHARLSGKDNPQFGKAKSEAHKRKISESLKGRIRSEESRRKQSETMTGVARGPMSDRHRINFMLARPRGELHQFFGKQRPDHAAKMKGRFAGNKNPMYGKQSPNKGKGEIFLFSHKDGRTFTGSISQLIANESLHSTAPYKAFKSKKTYKGWTILS